MEINFRLMYHMNGGITWDNLEGMSVRERNWYYERLVKQRKAENKAIEEANKR